MDAQALNELLAQAGIYAALFDAVRLVDALGGKLIEYDGQSLGVSDISCVDVFGTQERCKNCTSIRAFYSNEQVVKLEYVGGSILLIISAPIQYEGRVLVAELIKDITKSMTVDVRDSHRDGEVSGIIDNLNKLATTDNLTGLMNRRFIGERLPNILDNSQRIDRPVSVALIDIDFFKKVNDSYGHQAGDQILSAIASVLNSYIRRESDFAARYGGEEFLLCFPGTRLNDCVAISERIRLQIEGCIFEFEDQNIGVTVSIGVAESSEVGELSMNSIVALADRRLYEAKTSGRNRVVSA